MSYYEDLCRAECRWCAKGIPRLHKFMGGDWHRFEYIDDDSEDFPCTAPTESAVIDRLAAEVETLRYDSVCFSEVAGTLTAEVSALKQRIEQLRKLYDLTLSNELRWMRKHEEIQSEVSALKQERDELRKDKDRLDWLDRQKYGCFGKELFAGELAAQTQIEANGSAYKGYGMRDAIDGARKQEKADA